ncbi:30S ribosomal protein S20, chloroplastic [Macadamia integrifolia]|uniref:30S ribosomal protein S20, chloroplastic n=1 Tax=Macadamia integrifolia TaxID=60698 RepID=UPI001C4FC5F8|nr:30S ribosomal protein S20, chloroplastic [Macadamia integrifolia]
MAMATAHCLSSCLAFPCKSRTLSLRNSAITRMNQTTFRSLSFSTNLSDNAFFTRGSLSTRNVDRPARYSVVCEVAPKKKADSAQKRARQSEKRRIYHKARKSEFRTRMKKVFEALDVLKKKSDAQFEEILPVEKLIAEAYSSIDKAVRAGSLHRNTGAQRKSRLARRKKAVEIHHGWYTSAPAETA